MAGHLVGGLERWWMVKRQPWGNSFVEQSLSEDFSKAILHEVNAKLSVGQYLKQRKFDYIVSEAHSEARLYNADDWCGGENEPDSR